MQVSINWGNTRRLIKESNTISAIERSVTKLQRILQQNKENKIIFNLTYDTTTKKFMTNLHFITPGENEFITEEGYSLEESINNSIKDLRRKLRKDKEKRITLSRQKRKLNFEGLGL